MTQEKVQDQEEFSAENIPKSNWMKFEKVGDSIIGTFIAKAIKQGDEVYPAQMVYTVFNAKVNGEQRDPSEEFTFGVTIREGNANFINNKFSKLKPGNRFGLKFEKEIPPKKKGFHPAKSFMPNVFKDAEGAYKVDPMYSQIYGENFETSEAVPAAEGEIGVDAIPFN